jgi:signal transduction histidine kinase
MAYDASYEWVHHPRRWRRWVARFAAVIALAACGAGVYEIVHEASRPSTPAATSLQPEVRQVAASAKALARRLVALAPRSSTARALVTVREAQGDRAAASAALRDAQTKGKVADDVLLASALSAHRQYLSVLASVLRNPRSRIRGQLKPRALRAKAAWAALPNSAGLPRAIRGYGHVAALVRAHGG